jgi:hypothetical protein
MNAILALSLSEKLLANRKTPSGQSAQITLARVSRGT